MGVGAALLDGGVGVAAADVGVFSPPDEEVPVVVAVVVVAAVGVAVGSGSTAGVTSATVATVAVVLAKLGTNSIAFTFSLENFALKSFGSVSWDILLLFFLLLAFLPCTD